MFFMKRAVKEAAISNPVFVAADGQQAFDYFSASGQFSDRSAFPLPALVLLDLKLPRKRGLDFLGWLREQKAFQSVVVVVLTSSREPSDLKEAYRLGANSYLVKPSSANSLVALVKIIKSYWLDLNVFDSV